MKVIELLEGTWSNPDTTTQALALIKLLRQPLPASEATDKLYNLIGDDDLFDQIDHYKDKVPEHDVRPLVIKKLREWIEGDMSTWRRPWQPGSIRLLQQYLKRKR